MRASAIEIDAKVLDLPVRRDGGSGGRVSGSERDVRDLLVFMVFAIELMRDRESSRTRGAPKS